MKINNLKMLSRYSKGKVDKYHKNSFLSKASTSTSLVSFLSSNTSRDNHCRSIYNSESFLRKSPDRLTNTQRQQVHNLFKSGSMKDIHKCYNNYIDYNTLFKPRSTEKLIPDKDIRTKITKVYKEIQGKERNIPSITARTIRSNIINHTNAIDPVHSKILTSPFYYKGRNISNMNVVSDRKNSKTCYCLFMNGLHNNIITSKRNKDRRAFKALSLSNNFLNE